MIEVVRTTCEEAGVDKANIHFELFTPADGQEPRKAPTKEMLEAAEQGVSVDIILDGSTRSLN